MYRLLQILITTKALKKVSDASSGDDGVLEVRLGAAVKQMVL